MNKRKKYISEIIKTEYQDWKPGEVIFITASTGAGKSYFILHTYLQWAISKGWRILYLVNRKILQKQLREELKEVESDFCRENGLSYFSMNINQYISIETYQNIEKALKNFGVLQKFEWMDQFHVVVCDECHYFYTDSNFNTGTELSYLAVKEIFLRKIRIYISATMDKVKAYMKTEHLESARNTVDCIYQQRRYREYTLSENYENVILHILEDVDDLVEAIKSNICLTNEKWLVFVDSIDMGRDIKKRILCDQQREENQVVFIDADFENDDEANHSVAEIVKNKKSKKRVVISTAVMDNGITFWDQDLLNIAIFADTEETFLQMLGRRRRADMEKLSVYICKRNTAYFVKRLQYTKQIWDCCQTYKNELQVLYQRTRLCIENIGAYIRQVEKRQYYSNIDTQINCLTDCRVSNYQVNRIMKANQTILSRMLSDSYQGQCIKKICCSAEGIIQPNMFSINRVEVLIQHYEHLAKALEEDEYAFIRQQAQWLKISDDDLEQALEESTKDLREKNRSILQNTLEKVIESTEGRLTQNAVISLKRDIAKPLEYFINELERKGVELKGGSGIKKTDRPITPILFNTCMEIAELPYRMEKAKKTEEFYCFLSKK